MTRVLIGKYGQKMIFNRDSDAVKRSNTNGNVGLYKMMSLLFANNPNVEFGVFTDNDLEDVECADNVVDSSNMTLYDFQSQRLFGKAYDAMIVVAGLADYEQDRRVTDILNYVNGIAERVVILCEDPRCLESMEKDYRIYDMKPSVIMCQQDGMVMFRDRIYHSSYAPLELATAYQEELVDLSAREVERDLLVIANDAGSYDRLAKVRDMVQGVDCTVCGRADQMTIDGFNGKHVGEVEYDEVMRLLKTSRMTLCVPIRQGWVTSKYVEALLCGCLPVFHEDYGVELLSVMDDGDLAVVHDAASLKTALGMAADRRAVDAAVRRLRKDLVEPYVDGKTLSNVIMREVL